MKVLKKALLLLIIASNISGCAYVDNFKNNLGYIKEWVSREDYSGYTYNNSAVAFNYDSEKAIEMPTYDFYDTYIGGLIANKDTSNTSNFVYELRKGVNVSKEGMADSLKVWADEYFSIGNYISETAVEKSAGKVIGEVVAEVDGTTYKVKAISKGGNTLVIFEELLSTDSEDIKQVIDDAYKSITYLGGIIPPEHIDTGSVQ